MEDVMGRLARALEGRVYVAVCRGLWDFTAKEVFDYVEGLQEGKENKVLLTKIALWSFSGFDVGTSIVAKKLLLSSASISWTDVSTTRLSWVNASLPDYA